MEDRADPGIAKGLFHARTLLQAQKAWLRSIFTRAEGRRRFSVLQMQFLPPSLTTTECHLMRATLWLASHDSLCPTRYA